jgi:hypothetical protein
MPGRTLSAGLVCIATVSVAYVGDFSALPPQAVAAFAEGKQLLAAGKDARHAFAQAAQLLGDSTDLVFDSPGPCLNYGNASYLAGDLPNAVAGFRGGLMQDPHHRLLREHLAYARLQIQYPPEGRGRPEPEFWPDWLPRLHSGTWLSLAVVGYVLGWVAGAAWWCRRRPALALAALGFFAVACVASYGWNLLDRDDQRNRDVPLVVIAEEQVPLRTGNGASYPLHSELPRLRPGMEARLLAARGDWLQIRFASGEVGWVERSAVQAWALVGD